MELALVPDPVVEIQVMECAVKIALLALFSTWHKVSGISEGFFLLSEPLSALQLASKGRTHSSSSLEQ